MATLRTTIAPRARPQRCRDFVTASATERDSLLATRPDLQFEGTGFYEHNSQQRGDAPVYRFLDPSHGTALYTLRRRASEPALSRPAQTCSSRASDSTRPRDRELR